ncbi:MAG: hypothetical protein MUF71_03350 [Candidatus Kapabacteria bacterium]|jgi:class 3 adenylate cyclase/ligand-binding sensor domain-containing protein|nr:hypothetical protein [Candidatus Kapabacteria bacterium]
MVNRSYIVASSRFALAVLLFLIETAWVLISQMQPQANPVFERISVEQGLSSANINYIAQDRRGMLWFATEDGINRYDGITFTPFRQMLPDSLGTGAQSVLTIYQTTHSSTDALWLATSNRRTVSRFVLMTQSFQAFLFPNGVETSVHAFAELQNGQVLIGTSNGLFKTAINEATRVLQREQAVPTTLAIQVMVRDSGDTFWIAAQNGLHYFHAGKRTLTAVQTSVQDPITLLLPHFDKMRNDSAGRERPSALWIATRDNGLWLYFPREQRSLRVATAEQIGSRNIKTICATNPHQIWIGTDNGVAVAEQRGDSKTWHITRRFTHDLRNEQTLSGNLVNHIYQDFSGVLWLGTGYYGLSKYSSFRQKFRHYGVNLLKDNASLNSGYVRDIAEEGDNLWIATQTGGINRLNRKNDSWTYFRANILGTDTAWALRFDHKGQLWLGTVGGGLWQWNSTKQSFVRFAAIPAQVSIQLLYEDRFGTLWATGDNAPLYAISPDRTRIQAHTIMLSNASKASGKRILSMVETAQGQLLLGLPTGIAAFDRAQGQAHSLLGRYAVRTMLQDAQGDFWLGTRGQGLLHYRIKSGILTKIDTSALFAITEREGLPSNLVSAILQDSAQHLWVSTKQGLAEIDIATRKVVRTFGMDDGLQGREFHHGSAFQSPRGEMFFGGTNGFNAFFPSNVRINAHAPHIEITSVKKFGRDEMLTDSGVAASRTIHLRYDESTVSFSFVALDFHTPEANVYAYRMEGLDKGWIQCGTRREATYTSLDAGEYVFTVRAANNDGVWNDVGTSFRVIVTPPIWRTWWFIGLSVASVVCIGFVLYRMRIRSIEVRNAWLERQVEDRTAEIKEKNKELQQSLDEINILSSVLEGERNKSEDLLLNILPSSIAERLKWGETTIVDTFDSATVLFTDMVGFTKIASRVSAEELIVMLNRMFSEFDKLAEKHGVEKIKTIGDAYMAVAGVPIPNDYHAEAVADMALDIMQAIRNLAEQENLPIQIRAGIHTGYLTAGVIGEKKFAYDLWGDTVNTASRMESSGEAGRVQCSEATYNALKDLFDFEERGTIEVKGKGAMKTYFVLGRKK